MFKCSTKTHKILPWPTMVIIRVFKEGEDVPAIIMYNSHYAFFCSVLHTIGIIILFALHRIILDPSKIWAIDLNKLFGYQNKGKISSTMQFLLIGMLVIIFIVAIFFDVGYFSKAINQ